MPQSKVLTAKMCGWSEIEQNEHENNSIHMTNISPALAILVIFINMDTISFHQPENGIVDAGTTIKYGWLQTNVVKFTLTTINFVLN